MKTNFETIVKNMSAKEIILAMVDSLIPPPLISIDMGSFGRVETTVIIEKKMFGFLTIKPAVKESICYGCAATNTICKIAGKPFNQLNIGTRDKRAKAIKSSYDFLQTFENAIDALRVGTIGMYNYYAGEGEFAAIEGGFEIDLPVLYDNYTVDQLEVYKKLAEAQS